MFLQNETPLAFYYFSEMDKQEACQGFVILEEDIAEEDENIFIDWYSFYIMKKKEC